MLVKIYFDILCDEHKTEIKYDEWRKVGNVLLYFIRKVLYPPIFLWKVWGKIKENKIIKLFAGVTESVQPDGASTTTHLNQMYLFMF